MDDVGWGMDHSDSEFDTAALPSSPQSSYTGDFFAQIGRNWKIIRTWVSWKSFYPGKVLIVSLDSLQVRCWPGTWHTLSGGEETPGHSLRCLRASHARDRVDVIVVTSVRRVFWLERRRVPVHFMLHLLGRRVPVDEDAVGLGLRAPDTVPRGRGLSPGAGASAWPVTWPEAGLTGVGGRGLGRDLPLVPALATPTAPPTRGGRLVGARGHGGGDRAQARDVRLLGVPAGRPVSPSHV